MAPQSAARAGSVRRPRRPLAFLLHSTFGVSVSLFLGFVCFTGTIAAVSHEIEWLVDPRVRATASVEPKSWGELWAAAQANDPDAWISAMTSYDRSDAAYFVRTAKVALPSGDLDVYLDPGSGRVTGESRGPTFHAIMRALHYHLFLPGAVPFYIVSSMGLVLLLSLATGLLTYKKFWRGFFRMPRWQRDLRTLLGDLHRLIGLWSLWFTAVIGLTCLWYIVEQAGVDLNSAVPTASTSGRALPERVTGRDVDRWVALAKKRMPGLNVTAVIAPSQSGAPAIVQGQWRAWLVRERTNAVYIDPATDSIVGLRDAMAMPLGERVVQTADPLHFGNFGGLATKLIWAIFGLLLTILAMSGAIIFAKRTAAALTPRHSRQPC